MSPAAPLSSAVAAVSSAASAPAGAGPAGTVPELPRALSLGSFPEGDRIADLAAVAVDDRILLAWVTYFDQSAASGRPGRSAARSGVKSLVSSEAAKQGASVMVRSLDENGEPLTQPYVISAKALSVGGVAFASLSSEPPEVGLGWVGKENGVGQVFVTRLSAGGQKQSQRMITRSKSGCSDVALAGLRGEWAVSWVEAHGDRGEIFAARVGRDLAKAGLERRIVESRGETANLRLITLGDEVLVFWSEVRSEGEGGIFVARLLASDLSVRGDPILVASTPRHALALEAARVGDGAALAWVEQAPAGSTASPSTRTAFVATLDAAARTSPERVLALITPDPSSIAIDCDRVCHLVVPGAERGELALYGFSFDTSRKPDLPARLAAVASVSTEDVSPVLVKNWFFFAEDNLRGRGRIRKAKVAW